jgi:phosphoglycolate phosphatase-like HAD superfamily hydrolase
MTDMNAGVKTAGDVLLVFDLVSTLTDAGPRYAQAFIEVAEKAGHATPDREELLSMLGNKNLSEITDHFAGGMGEGEKKQFMAECNNACDILLKRPDFKEQLFPHVREAIESMNLRGITLGIYTGTREDAMAAQLKYHNITRLFDARYMRGKDNARDAGKKNDALKAEQLHSITEAFRQAQRNPAAPVIVIGDSAADAKAAEREGLYFIGFATSPAKKAELEQAGVGAIVTDFGDVPDLVYRLISPPANDTAAKPGTQRKLTP